MEKEKWWVKQLARNVLVPFLVISIIVLAIGFDIQHKQNDLVEVLNDTDPAKKFGG